VARRVNTSNQSVGGSTSPAKYSPMIPRDQPVWLPAPGRSAWLRHLGAPDGGATGAVTGPYPPPWPPQPTLWPRPRWFSLSCCPATVAPHSPHPGVSADGHNHTRPSIPPRYGTRDHSRATQGPVGPGASEQPRRLPHRHDQLPAPPIPQHAPRPTGTHPDPVMSNGVHPCPGSPAPARSTRQCSHRAKADPRSSRSSRQAFSNEQTNPGARNGDRDSTHRDASGTTGRSPA
jgi:hypothetical protein